VRLRDDVDERLLVSFDAERLPDFLLRERDEPSLVPRFVCRAPRADEREPLARLPSRLLVLLEPRFPLERCAAVTAPFVVVAARGSSRSPIALTRRRRGRRQGLRTE
jgi:hypothetical protein